MSDLRPPVVAELEVPEEIKAQTSERLLTLFAQLTHKIHGVEQAGRVDGPGGATDLRAQRDIVKREILERCDRA